MRMRRRQVARLLNRSARHLPVSGDPVFAVFAAGSAVHRRGLRSARSWTDCPRLARAPIRDAALLHGEEQEGAQLPPTAEFGG